MKYPFRRLLSEHLFCIHGKAEGVHNYTRSFAILEHLFAVLLVCTLGIHTTAGNLMIV